METTGISGLLTLNGENEGWLQIHHVSMTADLSGRHFDFLVQLKYDLKLPSKI